MKKTIFLGFVLAGFLLSGCGIFEKKKLSGAAVELHGNYLYRSTLDALTVGLNSEDSMHVAQLYIAQWAKDILVHEAVSAGKTSISPDELDRMVDEYRRMLYTHAYEEWIVEHEMSRTVLDSTVEQVYHKMPERFVLSESMIKGMIVVVPKDAPNIAKVRRWMREQSLDELEKYAYQMASGYELFTDRWLTTTDVISKMPIEQNDFEAILKTKDQVEVSDSLQTYILQVTEKQLRGGLMPIERAREEIEKMILSERQVEFLQKEREQLYEKAVQRGEIKYLE